MASSSSSSSSYNNSPKWTYDVFLSFRGEDTRKNFVDHLYTALADRAIYTFKDDQKLKRGKSISSELLGAIKQSRFAIVVFSKNYADSSWCLDELAEIIEWKNSMGRTVVPVFYDVDPSHVRKQTGCFEEAFAKHETNSKGDQIQMEKVQRWRKALAEAANTSGWDLPKTANGHESQCIKQIVGKILIDLGSSTTLSAEDNLIGLESRVHNVKSLLLRGSDEVQILGIWGMGGLGKSTVARAVFDNISNEFEGSSHVANVGKVSKSSGLQFLQEKIISEILMERDLKVRSVDEGINMMKRLGNTKVLLVLDDVDQLDQLDALAGSRDWFGKGSRIIITTRDEHLLVVHGVNEIHRAVLLNDDEALLLFSRYAFKSNRPPEEYVEPSRLVARNVGGLPLALKVLGSFLCGREMVEWKSALERLKHVGENEILNVLKISFDGLKYIEQQIFLDIACFFAGMKKDDVSEILDSFDFYPDIGLSVLIQKSLVTVSNGILQMHDLIREMGMNIVQEVDQKEPGRRSRLWLPEHVDAIFKKDGGTEAIEVIKLQDTMHVDIPDPLAVVTGTKAIEGTKLHGTMPVDVNDSRALVAGTKAIDSKMLQNIGIGMKYSSRVFGNVNSRVLENVNSLVRENVNSLVFGNVNSRVFENMKKLRLLHVSSSFERFRELEPEYLPNELRWIDWNGYPSKSLPSSFQAEKLVCLNIPHSNIVKLWTGKKILDKLKFIDLSESEKLTSTPDFSGAPNLERLILCGCKSLLEVHPSLGDLKRLTNLDFSRCKSLRSFSSDFNMTSLEILILSGCSELKVFPQIIGNMERLRELYLDGTFISKLHPSIGKLTGLVLMNLSNCENLKHLPSTIDSFKCMKTLDLSGCINLEDLPENLGQMASLEELLLNRTAITRPPSSIVLLKNLMSLSFGGFEPTLLSAITRPPTSIAQLKNRLPLSLFKRKCWESMVLVLQCLSGCMPIKKLNITYCNLLEIPCQLSQLSFLEELSLSGNDFTCLPNSLCQLSKLKVLELKECRNLKALEKLPSSIAVLMMDDCRSLESLGDLLTTKHEWLHEVSFSNCFKLAENEQRGCSSSCGFVDVMLQSMLQGRSVTSHQFSILVPGSEIPDWFLRQGIGKHFPNLPLVPNWQKRVAGCAICCVFKTTIPRKIRISLGLNDEKTLIFNESWRQMFDSEHVWIGYISLDFFREQILGDNYKEEDDSLGGTGKSFLRIHPTYTLGRIKKWGINAVDREDVKKLMMIEDEDDDSSQSAGNIGFFPPKKGVGHFYFD